MTSLILPTSDGGTRGVPRSAPPRPGPSRRARSPPAVAYAAAHVIPEAAADNTPGAPARLDWEATLAYRHELWSYGLGVADAMDTAQRGMGLDWAATQQLIKRTGSSAAEVAGTPPPADVRDLSPAAPAPTSWTSPTLPSGAAGLEAVIDAYREQIAVVSEAGAKVILMASRALARRRTGPDDYLQVYSTLLSEVDQPVILHWLGTMFDPALAGYWGSDDVAAATETFLALIRGPRGQGGRRQGFAAGRLARSRAAGRACRRASGSTPGTTSTTRN